jgi:hypothetical protein
LAAFRGNRLPKKEASVADEVLGGMKDGNLSFVK